MIKQLYRVGTVVATSAIVFASFGSSVLASTDITVSGNGAFSNNNVSLNQSTNTTVTQTNTATVTNNVSSSANTGGNSAFGNTGGDTAIHTGSATTNTTVDNALNTNAASVNTCGCQGDTTLKISGNGAVSDNSITDNSTHNTVLTQSNDATVTNNVSSNAKTGGNSADDNTGGTVRIGTGNASTSTNVSTNANHNVASVGGSSGNGGSGLDVAITGNGAFSSNDVNADLSSDTLLTQSNIADITNNVSQDAKTGHNSAFGDTGGDVMIGTGNAHTGATVMNDVNYNFANFGSCCNGDVTVKVAGNGADGSDGWEGFLGNAGNTVDLDLTNGQLGVQANAFDGSNAANVAGDAKTGGNDVNFSTGSVTDPSVGTGNASNDTAVSNVGNVNTLGSDIHLTPPPTLSSFSWAWFWSMCNCI